MSESQVGTIVLRVKFKQTVIAGLRLVEVLQLVMAHSTVHEEHLLLGHQFEALVIVGNRPLKVVEVLPRHATHLIGVNDKWVAVDG